MEMRTRGSRKRERMEEAAEKTTKVGQGGQSSKAKAAKKVNTEMLLEKVMNIHLISAQIFEYLDFRDLLECSGVSKTWNTMARRELRENRRCSAMINGDTPCQSVIDFNNLLVTSFNHPFNGLTIATENTCSQHLVIHSCVKVNGVDINEEMSTSLRRRLKYRLDASNLFPEILSQIKVKYLDIHWEDLTNIYCPAFQLISKLIAKSCPHLQYLHIRSLPIGATNNLTEMIFGDNPYPTQWLPKLKTFIPSCDYDDAHNIWEYAEYSTTVIQEFIAAAPNLQQVLGEICDEELDPYFEENKVHTLRCVRLELCPARLERIRRLFSPAYELNVRKIVFVISVPVPDTKEDVYEILRLIQERLGETLEELEISQVALTMLSNRRYCPFPKLKYLMIEYDPKVDLRGGYFTLSSVNFGWLFPNLESVDFEWGSLTIDLRLVTNEFDPSRRGCGSSSVTKLYISSCVLRSTDLPSWFDEVVNIFPCVKEFYLNEFRGQNFKECFESVWGAWKDLEVATLRFDSLENMCQNFDSCILGITDEESLDLYCRTDEDNFKDLHIVPIRPSIFNCPKLQKICFQIPPRQFHNTENRRYLLSAVGILLAINRHPFSRFQIEVMFHNDREQREYRFPLNHLNFFRNKR